MKKTLKVLALMLVLSAAAMAEVNTKVALITMDQMDEHWISVKQGADDRVAELNAEGNNIEMVWLAPETKDNQQQIEKMKNQILELWEELPPTFVSSSESGMGREEILDYIGSVLETLKEEQN